LVPLLTLHDAWVYWLIAAIGVALPFLFCQFILFAVFPGYWLRKFTGLKLRTEASPILMSPRIAFNTISLIVYIVAASLDQIPYAFAWFGIVAAADIFVSAADFTHKDQYGNYSLGSPPIQSGLVMIAIVCDALAAALMVGSILVFRQAVVLV
jgi:hypothetical protein